MTQPIPALSPARVSEILDGARGKTIVVIGDIMLDRYLNGDVERISPEAPVPVVMVEDEQVMPGGAANVAVNVAVAGARPRLIGSVGDDAAGKALLEALGALEIDSGDVLVISGRPTTSKTRIVARGQQIVRIDREVTNPLASQYRDAVLAAAHAAIAHAHVLLIEDYDKGTLDGAMAGDLVAAARQRHVPVIVDPKLRNFFAYSGATMFKPNRRELEAAFATHFMGDDSDLEDARQRLGTDHLLVTLGANGMALVSGNKPVRRANSLAREVFDVSGAGDTAAAWVAVALAGGADAAGAAWIANVAAGVQVGKRGTSSVSPAELMAAIPA